jgi:hypothetical protein
MMAYFWLQLFQQLLQVFVSDTIVLHECVQHFDGRTNTSVLYVVGNETIFAGNGTFWAQTGSQTLMSHHNGTSDERFSCRSAFMHSAPNVHPKVL